MNDKNDYFVPCFVFLFVPICFFFFFYKIRCHDWQALRRFDIRSVFLSLSLQQVASGLAGKITKKNQQLSFRIKVRSVDVSHKPVQFVELMVRNSFTLLSMAFRCDRRARASSTFVIAIVATRYQIFQTKKKKNKKYYVHE